MRPILILAILLMARSASSQDSTTISIGAYVDGYYNSTNRGASGSYLVHNSVGSIHNSFGLNVAQMTAALDSKWARGVMTLQFGDIPQVAWTGPYAAVQEANAGVRLAKNLWLDMGFFKTHVGTESFLPRDNALSILSLSAFWGPFYQSGARLSYDPTESWHLELHVINGYNQHIDMNQDKSVGILAQKQINDNLLASYSNMIGVDQKGLFPTDELLVYQNLYLAYEKGKSTVLLGADFAFEPDNNTGIDSTSFMLSGLLSYKFQLQPKWAVSGRFEWFHDPTNIISSTYQITELNQNSAFFSPRPTGFSIVGLTAGIEFRPSEHAFLRLESRYLYDQNFSGEDAVLLWDGVSYMTQDRLETLLTAGITFDKLFNLRK